MLAHLIQGKHVLVQAATLPFSFASWVHDVDLEGQGLEERHRVLATHFFEDHSEFVVRDFIDEMALELYNDVVTSENGAESVALVSEEAEAVAFKDDGVIETCLDRGLSAHDREVKHVFQALVANFDREGEGLGLGVHRGRSYLLEFDLGLQFLNSLLNDRVMLIHNIYGKLRGVQSERVSGRIVRSKFW